MIITIIQYALAVVFGLLLGYQLLLSLVAVRAKKLSHFYVIQNRKFAIVLFAHNEEKVIAKSLYSLSGLVYPKNLYDLVVVADNCTDSSAAIARNLGAIVLEQTDETERGKGYVLRWAFDQIMSWDKSYDAIIVFDSDSLVSGNYLEVMNYYLENGSKVIQSCDLLLPEPGVWKSEVMQIGLLLYNYVKPLGRKALRLGTRLSGSGMCFSTEVLRQIPWEQSLTEIVEYSSVLQLRGIKINFAPEAIVWTQRWTQQEKYELQYRGEIRRYSTIQKYASRLLAAAIQKKSFRYLDSYIDLVTPSLINLLLSVLAMCGINGLLWAIGLLPVSYLLLWTGITILGAIYLFMGLYVAEADRGLYKSIFYIPLYVLWKIRCYFKVESDKKGDQQKRTPRESIDILS